MNFDVQKWRADAETTRQKCEQAIKLNPEGVAGHRDLGWALYNLGKYSEAEDPLRRAVALKPDDYFTHYHLGLVLTELGRLEVPRTNSYGPFNSIQTMPMLIAVWA